jgi:hypothetical protein
MRLTVQCAVAACVVVSSYAGAVELRPITVRKGTEGLDPAPVTVTNRTANPIVCIAEIAHWYSAELARVPAATDAPIGLWRDPSDGAYVALNDKQENMPVERLWCGFEGRAYETRGELVLDRAAPPVPRSVVCREQAGRVVCG